MEVVPKLIEIYMWTPPPKPAPQPTLAQQCRIKQEEIKKKIIEDEAKTISSSIAIIKTDIETAIKNGESKVVFDSKTISVAEVKDESPERYEHRRTIVIAQVLHYFSTEGFMTVVPPPHLHGYKVVYLTW